MKVSKQLKTKFLKKLRKWYRENKRDFPWRYESDPFKILVSEILLQKTNVLKVLPVYERFIKKYPDPQRLGNANLSEVKILIKNLGLLYRAERFISIGNNISKYYQCKIPNKIEELIKINGLGKYISSAVTCFAFNKRVPIVDTNVIRLFERIFGFKSKKKRSREDNLIWKFAASLLPSKKVRDYNYALLDLSAVVCTSKNPKHDICPFKDICQFYKKKIINP